MSRPYSLHFKVLGAFLCFLALALYLLPSSAITSTPVTVANDAKQVTGVSTTGSYSLSTGGGQKLLEDSFGKFISIYIDTSGRLSLAYANSNPSTPSSWVSACPTCKLTGSVPFSYPAGVLLNPTSLRIIVQGGSGLQQTNDLPVTITRDSSNNINGFSFGPLRLLDGSGFAQYPTAILSHSGDILAGWNWLNTADSSRVKTLRWNHLSGSWVSFTGIGSTPDDAVVDSANRAAIFPNLIERPDNFNVYVFGNRDSTGPSNLVFNKATATKTDWSWGAQNLAYELIAAQGIQNAPSLTWDPVKGVVVSAFGLGSGTGFG